MTYWYDEGQIRDEAVPYTDWGKNGIQPVAPANDGVRQAVLDAIERCPSFGPLGLKSDLRNFDGLDVSVEVICGVNAGM